MKKLFKYDRDKNQYSLNHKGKWIYIDQEDFQKMSDEDVSNLVKGYEKEKPKKETSYVEFDEFKKGLDDVRAYIKRENPNLSFKEFLKLRYQPKA